MVDIPCEPPQCVLIVERPAEIGEPPSEVLEPLLEALEPATELLDSVTAATGWGLRDDFDSEAFEALQRLDVPVPALGGLRLSYVIAGDPDGRQVILVHGAPGDAADWGRFLLDVPPGLQYLSPDRPGYGESGPAEGAVTALADQAAALAQLFETRGGRKPILVGYSMGAPIALRAAADYGDAIGALLIVGGAADPMLEDPTLLQELGSEEALALLLPRDLDSANQELLALRAELTLMAPLLRRIDVPVTLLHGTADSLVPVDNVAFMAAHLGGAEPLRIVLVEEADHFLPWDHYELLKRQLLQLDVTLEAAGR